MLAAGGLPLADGANPHSGEHRSIADALTAAQPRRAVKLLDPTPGLWELNNDWQAVWLDRDPRWQAESLRKFLAFVAGQRMTVAETRQVRESLIRDRAPAVEKTRSWCPTLTLSYEDVLATPQAAACEPSRFLPWACLDVAAMAAVVHSRSGRMLPDLRVEAAS
jgi:hypothetical protein